MSATQVRIESDPKLWPAEAARLASQRAQREAIQATQKKVHCFDLNITLLSNPKSVLLNPKP